MDIRVQEGCFYTEQHEWIKLEGRMGKIGITDYAQQKLGDITFVELPDLDNEIRQFEILASIESVKAASDIFSPLSGKIIAVNSELEDEPQLVNQSPYEDGWIVEIEVSDKSEIENLMAHTDYKNHVSSLE